MCGIAILNYYNFLMEIAFFLPDTSITGASITNKDYLNPHL